MRHFDYEQTAREAGIPENDLAAIRQAMRVEFPDDDMMWELHVLRACLAVRDGKVALEEVLGRRAA
jgi:hypothetical protein